MLKTKNGFKCPICQAFLISGEGCTIADGTCDPFSARTCPACDSRIAPAIMYAGVCRSCKLKTRLKKGDTPLVAHSGVSDELQHMHTEKRRVNCTTSQLVCQICGARSAGGAE